MATQFAADENPNWKRPFFTIWVVQALSLLGSQLVQFAIIWYLTVETESAAVLATATMAGVLPAVILSPFIGVLVDRWNRCMIMIVADSIVAVLTAVLVMLSWQNVVEIWHIYMLSFLRSIAGIGCVVMGLIQPTIPAVMNIEAGPKEVFPVQPGSNLTLPSPGSTQRRNTILPTAEDVIHEALTPEEAERYISPAVRS